MSSNQINLFSNKSLNVCIKTITDDNNVLWFRAKDIALFLGYKNPRNAIQTHVYGKYKTQLCNIEATEGALNPVSLTNSNLSLYINEQGLYQLVFHLVYQQL